MAVTADTSELDALAADLASAGARVLPRVAAVTRKGALNVKNALRAEAEGVAHAPGLPAAITYDTTFSRGGVEAQIGPREGGAGSLALLYFGNSKTGPRLPDPVGALEREAPSYVEHLGAAVAEAILP
jgi:hypothetical protein